MKKIRKICLSGVVILAFVFYAVHQSQEDSTAAASVVAPIQNTINSTELNGKYRDGQYIGPVADAFYGNVQVRITVSNGKISDVQFLQYPNDRRTSIEISKLAMPLLKKEAIAAQNANVDIVSGATQTSGAFKESMQGALNQAKS